MSIRHTRELVAQRDAAIKALDGLRLEHERLHAVATELRATVSNQELEIARAHQRSQQLATALARLIDGASRVLADRNEP